MDQVVSLPATQRTEPTSSAAQPPGSDTTLHTATTVGQLSCRRGAGECWSCVSLCVFTHMCLCSVSLAVICVISKDSFTYFMTWMNLHEIFPGNDVSAAAVLADVSQLMFFFFFFFLSHRLHCWWKWAFPGSTPSRPSELQITTSTWQPTSSCNTERESSAKKNRSE